MIPVADYLQGLMILLNISPVYTHHQHWPVNLFKTESVHLITHLSFDASSPRTSVNICINLILPETRVIGLHHRRYSMGVSSFKFLWWAPKDACVLKEYVMTLQGHPRSILAPIKSVYATSYWSSIVTLILSCPVSEILQDSC